MKCTKIDTLYAEYNFLMYNRDFSKARDVGKEILNQLTSKYLEDLNISPRILLLY